MTAEGTPSGSFEAWASGPVHPEVWLTYAKWNHPQWPDGSPVLVGDTLRNTETEDIWVVLAVRLEQRYVAEAPSIELGNPIAGPAEDDLVLYAESIVGTADPCRVVVPDGLERAERWADIIGKDLDRYPAEEEM